MSRRVLSAVAVLLALAGFVVAAEIKGKITKVDADNNKITVSVDDKEQEFTITKETKIISSKGNELKSRLKSKYFSAKELKRGVPVVIKTVKKGDKEVVSEVKLTSGGKKKEKEK